MNLMAEIYDYSHEDAGKLCGEIADFIKKKGLFEGSFKGYTYNTFGRKNQAIFYCSWPQKSEVFKLSKAFPGVIFWPV